MNAIHYDLRLADIGQAFTFFAPGLLGRAMMLLTIRALRWLRAPLPARQLATDVCDLLTGHATLEKAGLAQGDGRDVARSVVMRRRAALGLDERGAAELGDELFDVWREVVS